MATSVKRTRIARSSSHGEIGLPARVNQIDSKFSLWEKTRAAIKRAAGRREFPARRRVPTFELQPLETASFSNKRHCDGEFLSACSLCKKKFDEDDDIFMYGFKGAFCSLKCRSDQIVQDGFVKIEDTNESFVTKNGPEKEFK